MLLRQFLWCSSRLITAESSFQCSRWCFPWLDTSRLPDNTFATALSHRTHNITHDVQRVGHYHTHACNMYSYQPSHFDPSALSTTTHRSSAGHASLTGDNHTAASHESNVDTPHNGQSGGNVSREEHTVARKEQSHKHADTPLNGRSDDPQSTNEQSAPQKKQRTWERWTHEQVLVVALLQLRFKLRRSVQCAVFNHIFERDLKTPRTFSGMYWMYSQRKNELRLSDNGLDTVATQHWMRRIRQVLRELSPRVSTPHTSLTLPRSSAWQPADVPNPLSMANVATLPTQERPQRLEVDRSQTENPETLSMVNVVNSGAQEQSRQLVEVGLQEEPRDLAWTAPTQWTEEELFIFSLLDKPDSC